MRSVKCGSRMARLGGVEQTQRKDLPGSRSIKVIGQVATWFDLAAQRPMIRKMYGMIFARGDSANRVRPGRPDEFARSD